MTLYCAYCGIAIDNNNHENCQQQTKEHSVPKSLNKAFISEHKTIYRRIPLIKYTENSATTKDVCQKCNNEYLSQLDNYGNILYERYFKYTVSSSSMKKFTYDHTKLTKYLLKLVYNTRRSLLKDYSSELRSLEFKEKEGKNNNEERYNLGKLIKMINEQIENLATVSKFIVSEEEDNQKTIVFLRTFTDKQLVMDKKIQLFPFRAPIYHVMLNFYGDEAGENNVSNRVTFFYIAIYSFVFLVGVFSFAPTEAEKLEVISSVKKQFKGIVYLSPEKKNVLVRPTKDNYADLLNITNILEVRRAQG